jgi:hypothetical protein
LEKPVDADLNPTSGPLVGCLRSAALRRSRTTGTRRSRSHFKEKGVTLLRLLWRDGGAARPARLALRLLSSRSSAV